MMHRDLTRRLHPAIPPVLPPSGPVPAATRWSWAMQAMISAGRHASEGRTIEADTCSAIAARQVALIEGRVG